MTDMPKPERPKIRFKRVGGKEHVPPPSPATLRNRRKAEANPPPPKPVAAAKPERPKREPSPLNLYKKSEASDIKGVNDTARALVEAMVWQGLNRRDAIEKLGISASYGHRLLRSPDTMAHYLAELDVLRNSGKARLVHRLEELTEQDDNQTAAVGAAKVLLSMDGPGKAAGGPTVNVNVLSPGWVIDATAALSGQRQLGRLTYSDDKPLIEHDPSESSGLSMRDEAHCSVVSKPIAERPAVSADRPVEPRRAGGGGLRDLAALRGGVGGKNGSPSSTS